MSKPETLKDIIEETMRVSGVPYKVPVPGQSINVDSINHTLAHLVALRQLSTLKATSTPEEFKGGYS
jgi:hypothetical protein